MKLTKNPNMRLNKVYWYDHKPYDDNEGLHYGFEIWDYESNDEGDLVEIFWYKSEEKRDKELKQAIDWFTTENDKVFLTLDTTK